MIVRRDEARKAHEAQEEIKKQAYAKSRKQDSHRRHEQYRTRPSRSGFHTASAWFRRTESRLRRSQLCCLYQRSPKREQGAFDLPQRWIDKKAPKLETQFNFVSDADIIGAIAASGCEQGERIRWHYFRRQHSVARARLFFADQQARAVSSIRASPKRCAKFTTRPRWHELEGKK